MEDVIAGLQKILDAAMRYKTTGYDLYLLEFSAFEDDVMISLARDGRRAGFNLYGNYFSHCSQGRSDGRDYLAPTALVKKLRLIPGAPRDNDQWSCFVTDCKDAFIAAFSHHLGLQREDREKKRLEELCAT